MSLELKPFIDLTITEGPVMRTVFGEASVLIPVTSRCLLDLSTILQPTGTSVKFVNMMVQALEEFQDSHRVKLQKITRIPLEGDGIIERRVEK
jgi:hypothetical protein